MTRVKATPHGIEFDINNNGSFEYMIEKERIQTMKDAEEWIDFLREKNWFTDEIQHEFANVLAEEMIFIRKEEEELTQDVIALLKAHLGSEGVAPDDIYELKDKLMTEYQEGLKAFKSQVEKNFHLITPMMLNTAKMAFVLIDEDTLGNQLTERWKQFLCSVCFWGEVEDEAGYPAWITGPWRKTYEKIRDQQ